MQRIRKTWALFLAGLLCAGLLAGCGETTQEPAPPETEPPAAAQEPVEQACDWSVEFHGMNGCAVFYSPQENTYWLYQEDLCRRQVSPFSTFKIPAALMGLHNGVLTDDSTTMDYSGRVYSHAEWNHNVTLQEAMQTSCVWYFRQVIDRVGEEAVRQELTDLGYGNCDTSAWQGSGRNPVEELNGFWLGSTLKISPMEQVQVLARVMEGESLYTDAEVETLKAILPAEVVGTQTICGKTGTGYDGEGWFVGFAEENGQRVYFAVYLDDSQNGGSGQAAKKIAQSIAETKACWQA